MTHCVFLYQFYPHKRLYHDVLKIVTYGEFALFICLFLRKQLPLQCSFGTRASPPTLKTQYKYGNAGIATRTQTQNK